MRRAFLILSLAFYFATIPVRDSWAERAAGGLVAAFIIFIMIRTERRRE